MRTRAGNRIETGNATQTEIPRKRRRARPAITDGCRFSFQSHHHHYTPSTMVFRERRFLSFPFRRAQSNRRTVTRRGSPDRNNNPVYSSPQRVGGGVVGGRVELALTAAAAAAVAIICSAVPYESRINGGACDP